MELSGALSFFQETRVGAPSKKPAVFDNIKGLDNTFPSSVPKINFLIWVSQDLHYERRDSWVPMNKVETKNTLSHELFILLPIGFKRGKFDARLQITNVKVFKFCKCNMYSTFEQIQISDFSSIKNITGRVYPYAQENILWIYPTGYLSQRSTEDPLHRRIADFIGNFDTDIGKNTDSKDKYIFMSRVYANLWASALKNYSVVRPASSITFINSVVDRYTWYYLAFGVSWEVNIFMEDSEGFYPVVANNSVMNLRFVSCGDRGYKPLAFKEYLSVFDYQVWMGIVAVIISLATLVDYLQQRQNSANSESAEAYHVNIRLLSVIMVLLEKEFSFPSRVTESFRVRIVVSSYLLASVVISNAYKNNNVYHMIAPREPIPLETFEELMNDNFIVYARIGYLNYWSTYHYIVKTKTIFSPHIIHGLSLKDALSEVHLMNFGWLGNASVKTKQLFDMVYENVSIHVSVFSLIRRINRLIETIYNQVGYQGNTNSPEYTKLTGMKAELTSLIRTKEKMYLLEHMTRCNKSAIVVPEHVSSEYAKILVQAGKSHVFIGKETYTKLFYGFRLGGYVPFHLVRRIKSVEVAGLWDWWSKFISRDLELANSWVPNTLVKPNMSGNVVVIFLLLLSGFGLALLCCLLEMAKEHRCIT